MIKVKLKKSLLELKIDIDFIVNEKFVSIFGKSGSGKTTILRCIAGLETPDEGQVVFKDITWFSSEKNINLPPQKRSISFVFQQPALFPNMSVEENIRYAMSKKDEKFFERLVSIANIEKLLNRKPKNLSGGEKQKVSLIRAIARKPDVLLLDEPFTALDFETKFEIYEELKILSKDIGFYTILVSHDIFEVSKFTNKVFYIEKGSITKTGKPTEILPIKQYFRL
ncbi:MAG TPA: ATP-binding cassette domain-containing protein [Hydrogenothermaceae bacterium]|nr:ATP-binding cassette domain-containing protein [Hydrogenothermaceae bacterium]